MKYVILFLFLLLLGKANAQKEATHWYFGRGAELNFANGYPIASDAGAIEFEYGGSPAIMSDPETGEPLFYTDGRSVWDRNRQVMPNGQRLIDEPRHVLANYISLIVPVPEQKNRFYLFTLSRDNVYSKEHNLFYHQIDMSLNGGLGDVVASQKGMLLLRNLSGRMAAVPHANGKDFWLLTHDFISDAFYTASVSANGVSDFTAQRIGAAYNGGKDTFTNGYLKASPDGRKLAAAVGTLVPEPLNLFDFDPSTGLISNYKPIKSPGAPYGLSFSPDNTKLYVSFLSLHLDEEIEGYLEIYNVIFQYDVSKDDLDAINASETALIVGNPYLCLGLPRNAGGPPSGLQLAPDGRIYSGANFLTPQTDTLNHYLLVINHPNRKGYECMVELRKFDFGGARTSGHPPLFIESYFNGLEPVGAAPQAWNSEMVQLYPNPTTGTVRLAFVSDCISDQTFTLRIVNAIGQEMQREQSQVSFDDELDISGYAAGLYLFILTFPENQQVVKKVVKVN